MIFITAEISWGDLWWRGRAGQALLPPSCLTCRPFAHEVRGVQTRCASLLPIPPSRCQRLAPSPGSRVLSAKSMLPVKLHFPTSVVITDASYLLGGRGGYAFSKSFGDGILDTLPSGMHRVEQGPAEGQECHRCPLEVPSFYNFMTMRPWQDLVNLKANHPDSNSLSNCGHKKRKVTPGWGWQGTALSAQRGSPRDSWSRRWMKASSPAHSSIQSSNKVLPP